MTWYGWYLCGMFTVPTLLFLGFGGFCLWALFMDFFDWTRR